jgi:hypothetical protein
VIIDLVTEVEENEPPSLLYNDIRQELCCCWHDVSFTIRDENVIEPQTEDCGICSHAQVRVELEEQLKKEESNDEKTKA